MQLRTNKTGIHAANGDTAILAELTLATDSSTFSAQATDRLLFATESLTESQTVAINQTANNLQAVMQSVANRLNIAGKFSNDLVAVAESAAVTAAFASMAGSSAVSRNTNIGSVRPEGVVYSVTSETVPNYAGKRSERIVAAMEAFDSTQQRNAALYSMAYNYVVALQDDFNETIWPMLTLPADQIGFGILVNRLTVWKGISHDVTGRPVDGGKVDLCRAGVDHTILSRKKNRAIPVHRAAAADKFVDTTILTPWQYTEEGADFTTSAYATGVQVGIMGLCQTDAQLLGGAANQTDTLDPAVSLDDVFIKVGDDLIKVNVYGRQGANFVYAQQDRTEDRRLTFNSKYIVLKPTTTNVDATALTDLAVLAANNLHVVIEVSMSGNLNTEYTNVEVFGNRVGVVRVVDADNKPVDPTTADAQTIAAAIAGAKIVGYTLKAYKTNINLRERGDLVDRNQFTQLYEVPLLSPITYQRPIGQNGENDAADFETLVTVTRFRLAGDGVTAILESFERIRDFTQVPFTNEDAPSGLGASRFHIKPYCADLTGVADTIDVSLLVSSLDNASAIKNVQAAIVNKMRDVAFSMFIMSEFQSAMRALGIPQESLKLIVATDPYIRRYIMVDGDLRTLTDKFEVKFVDTIDERFRGLIFMTFGIFDENRNQAPNILNWGNLIWAPESVVSANMPKGDAMARETIVQPRYLFVNHLACCAMLKVINIGQVFDESYLKVKQV